MPCTNKIKFISYTYRIGRSEKAKLHTCMMPDEHIYPHTVEADADKPHILLV